MTSLSYLHPIKGHLFVNPDKTLMMPIAAPASLWVCNSLNTGESESVVRHEDGYNLIRVMT